MKNIENKKSNVISKEALQPQVFNVRGKRVVLDREVAAYVGMSTGNLNLAVKRNIHLFDEEKRFKLCEDECSRFQFAILNSGRGSNVKYLPYVFTAEGIQMLERVLKREINIDFGEDVCLPDVMIENHITGTQFRFRDLIYTVRGVKVMLDSDLAMIYNYTTKALNQQVKNNAEKFDERFMFQLTKEEYEWCSRSKFFTLNTGRGSNMKYLPYAFTEEGVYMLMTVLKGELATRQTQALIIAFTEMKEFFRGNQCLTSGCTMQYYIEKQDEKLNQMNERMDSMVTRTEFEDIVQGFTDLRQVKHLIIYNGAIMEANYAYMSIYAEAMKTIYVVDNYIGARTLELLCSGVNNGVSITIFSENAGKQLTKNDVDKALNSRRTLDVKFKHNGGVYHDRCIVLDYGGDTERIYDCGGSSKDAGSKITVIKRCDNTRMYHYLVDELLKQPELVLK